MQEARGILGQKAIVGKENKRHGRTVRRVLLNIVYLAVLDITYAKRLSSRVCVHPFCGSPFVKRSLTITRL